MSRTTATAAQLDANQLHPELADELLAGGAGQCWASLQERDSARSGDYPHGTVEDCLEGDDRHGWSSFQRIWNDNHGVWLNTYACPLLESPLAVS